MKARELKKVNNHEFRSSNAWSTCGFLRHVIAYVLLSDDIDSTCEAGEVTARFTDVLVTKIFHNL